MKKIFAITLSAFLALAACDNKKVATPEEEIHRDSTQTGQSTVGPDSLNNWISDNPNDALALAARARFYLDQKNLKYAFADAFAAHQIDSLNPKVLLEWGNVNYVQAKTRISKNAWEQCIVLDKKSVECRLKLAELYNIVQDFKQSIKLCDEVIAIDPNDPIAYFIKGINLRDRDRDTATALNYFQKAIDLDNNYTAALDMMGVMLSAQKDPMAVAYFNRLLEINPNDYTTHYNLGMYYLGAEDWNNAIKTFTQCTQLNPQDIESLFNLGYIHLQLRKFDIARDYFSQSLAIQPVNHRALYGRAYAFEMLGDVKNAERDYSKALNYNPQHEPSKIGLQRVRN
jgi:tetratricopeptide (TPR) repeat protein